MRGPRALTTTCIIAIITIALLGHAVVTTILMGHGDITKGTLLVYSLGYILIAVPLSCYAIAIFIRDRNRPYEGAESDRTSLVCCESSAPNHSEVHGPDTLTGLPGKDTLRRAMSDAFNEQKPFVLFLIDIDRLGRLNVALGSDTGDAIISAVASRLCALVDELPACLHGLIRYSGDEFAFLHAHSEDPAIIQTVAERIINAFHAPLIIDDRPVGVSLSIGLAHAPDDGARIEDIERSAQLAVHSIRPSDPQRYGFCRASSSVYDRLVMEEELRQAIEREELVVFFQPQVDLRDGAVTGAEALVRWQHPTRGIVGPLEFIGLAEEMGLIDKIGQHVLNQTAYHIAVWSQQGFAPKIAVNVSASQCAHPDFCGSVFGIMSAHNAPIHLLQIELTESMAMSDPAATARQLAPLRASGIQLAMDDFGTGYSNLAMLTRMPFDVLKIDRSFVKECIRDGAARVVVSTILTMAQNLGYQTIAEGVETEAQRDFLLRYGCTYAQGYLYGKPMPADEFERHYMGRGRADARDLQHRIRTTI